MMRKSSLLTLVSMQIKEKYNLGWLRSWKSIIFKLAFFIVEFAVVLVAIYFVFWVFQYFGFFSLNHVIPINLVTTIFIILFLLSLVTTTIELVKNLYFSKDNLMLLTFPCRPNVIFFSKIIVAYLSELKRSIFTIIPLFAAFILINKEPNFYFIFVILGYLFTSLIVVFIAGVLSVPALFVTILIRGKLYVQIILIAVTVTALAFFVFYLTSLIPENFNFMANFGRYYYDIQNGLDYVNNLFLPLRHFSEMMVGSPSILGPTIGIAQLGDFGIMLGGLVVLALISYLLERQLFFKMATKQSNGDRHVSKTALKKVNRSKPVVSMLKSEARKILRSPARFFATYLFILVLPFTIYFMDRIFASMNTRLVGSQMVLTFNLLISLLIILSNNVMLASVFSKEGVAATKMKITPTNFSQVILGKILIPLILSLISLIATMIIMGLGSKTSLSTVFFFFFIIAFIFLGHMLWSVELDLVSPEYRQYYNGDHNGINKNEVMSFLIGVITSYLLFAFTLYLIIENPDGEFATWIKILAIAIAYFIVRLIIFTKRTKSFYRSF
jgi:hypothetical protein